MHSCLVSIITVCYNSEKTIERTIYSVLHQTFTDIEYIIIDGKSTDGTMNIIRKNTESYKSKVTVVSEQDNGIYDAMNKGIRLAKGEIIGIINSDDFYELDTVENIMKYFDNHKLQVLYGLMRVLDNGIEKKILMDSHHYLRQEMIPHCTCFVSKKAYQKYGLYDLKYKYVADYDLLYRYSKVEEIEFVPIYCILANFSEGGASSSYDAKIESLRFRFKKKLISRKQYMLLVLKQKMKQFIGEF